MRIRLLLITSAASALVACNSSHTVKLEDKDPHTTTSVITVQLGFIDQISALCRESLGVEATSQEVATCTLDRMQLFNISTPQLEALNNAYCDPAADLSQLTPDQLANVQLLCASLNGGPQP
jgi:hypothetical protein